MFHDHHRREAKQNKKSPSKRYFKCLATNLKENNNTIVKAITYYKGKLNVSNIQLYYFKYMIHMSE